MGGPIVTQHRKEPSGDSSVDNKVGLFYGKRKLAFGGITAVLAGLALALWTGGKSVVGMLVEVRKADITRIDDHDRQLGFILPATVATEKRLDKVEEHVDTMRDKLTEISTTLREIKERGIYLVPAPLTTRP